MIYAGLFIYIGIKLGAPFWYYLAICIGFAIKMFTAGIKLIDKCREATK